MKKLILILVLVLAFVSAEAQLKTSSIRAGITYVQVTTDYTLTNAVAQYWLVKAPQHYYTAQSLVIQLDSASGDHTNVAIQLQGRLSQAASGQDAWTNIGSAINWKGTTSDTTIVYANATENLYKQFKILYTGTGTGTTTIDNQEFNQFFGLP